MYIARAITRECCLNSEISKRFNPQEETAKRPVVIENDARQETKCSFRMCNIQNEVIVIDENDGQQCPAKHPFEVKLPIQTWKKSKHSKMAGKDANQTKRTPLIENSVLSRFDGNFPESFPFSYTSLAPVVDTVSQDWILNCRGPPR